MIVSPGWPFWVALLGLFTIVQASSKRYDIQSVAPFYSQSSAASDRDTLPPSPSRRSTRGENKGRIRSSSILTRREKPNSISKLSISPPLSPEQLAARLSARSSVASSVRAPINVMSASPDRYVFYQQSLSSSRSTSPGGPPSPPYPLDREKPKQFRPLTQTELERAAALRTALSDANAQQSPEIAALMHVLDSLLWNDEIAWDNAPSDEEVYQLYDKMRNVYRKQVPAMANWLGYARNNAIPFVYTFTDRETHYWLKALANIHLREAALAILRKHEMAASAADDVLYFDVFRQPFASESEMQQALAGHFKSGQVPRVQIAMYRANAVKKDLLIDRASVCLQDHLAQVAARQHMAALQAEEEEELRRPSDATIRPTQADLSRQDTVRFPKPAPVEKKEAVDPWTANMVRETQIAIRDLFSPKEPSTGSEQSASFALKPVDHLSTESATRGSPLPRSLSDSATLPPAQSEVAFLPHPGPASTTQSTPNLPQRFGKVTETPLDPPHPMFAAGAFAPFMDRLSPAGSVASSSSPARETSPSIEHHLLSQKGSPSMERTVSPFGRVVSPTSEGRGSPLERTVSPLGRVVSPASEEKEAKKGSSMKLSYGSPFFAHAISRGVAKSPRKRLSVVEEGDAGNGTVLPLNNSSSLSAASSPLNRPRPPRTNAVFWPRAARKSPSSSTSLSPPSSVHALSSSGSDPSSPVLEKNARLPSPLAEKRIEPTALTYAQPVASDGLATPKETSEKIASSSSRPTAASSSVVAEDDVYGGLVTEDHPVPKEQTRPRDRYFNLGEKEDEETQEYREIERALAHTHLEASARDARSSFQAMPAPHDRQEEALPIEIPSGQDLVSKIEAETHLEKGKAREEPATAYRADMAPLLPETSALLHAYAHQESLSKQKIDHLLFQNQVPLATANYGHTKYKQSLDEVYYRHTGHWPYRKMGSNPPSYSPYSPYH